MASTIRRQLTPAVGVEIISTEARDGDFAVSAAEVDRRRRALVDAPWTWLRLQHGAVAVPVDRPGAHAGGAADAGATLCLDAPIGVTTADCAGMVLVATDGEHRAGLAVVHAGWRGLVAGVVEAAAALLDQLAGRPLPHRTSVCSPCIGPEHYEFARPELALVVERYGSVVLSETVDGRPALDLFAGVRVAVERAGFIPPERPPSTADPRYFSHRVRADGQRLVTVARLVERG